MFVDCIPQQSTNICWAAAMAMLLQALSGHTRSLASRRASPFDTSFTPRYVAEQAGFLIAYDHNLMLTSVRQNFVRLAHSWGLTVTSGVTSLSSIEWGDLLNRPAPFSSIST